MSRRRHRVSVLGGVTAIVSGLSGLAGNYLADQWQLTAAVAFIASLIALAVLMAWRPPLSVELSTTENPTRRRRPLMAPLLVGAAILVVLTLPLPPATSTSPTGVVLVSDDFTADTGWAMAPNKPKLEPLRPIDGTLRLVAENGQDIAAFSKIADQAPPDSITEVDITRATGRGEYGAVCRVGTNAGYQFTITDANDVDIFKMVNGALSSLSGWRSATSLRPSGANHVVMSCRTIGNAVQLDLWINGSPANSATDSTDPLLAGKLALFAHPVGKETLIVEVDNLVIKKL